MVNLKLEKEENGIEKYRDLMLVDPDNFTYGELKRMNRELNPERRKAADELMYTIYDFLTSFVFSISAKKMKRYTDKMRKKIFDTIFKPLASFPFYAPCDFYTECIDLLARRCGYYKDGKDIFYTFMHDLFWEETLADSDICDFPKEKMDGFFYNNEPVQGITVTDVLDNELNWVCARYLSIMCDIDECNEKNYIYMIPDEVRPLLFILEFTLNLAFRKIEMIFLDDLYLEHGDDKLKKQNKVIRELQAKGKKQEELLNEKDREISSLKERIRQIKMQHKDQLEKRDKKLLKKETEYMKLVHELEEFRGKDDPEPEDNKESVSEIVESEDREAQVAPSVARKVLRRDLRYLFVISDDFTTTAKDLQKIFPNSVYKNSATSKIQIANSDAVIFFSKNIAHIRYFGLKDTCKRLKIPFVHCNEVNIDRIISTMEEGLGDPFLIEEDDLS